MNNIEIQKSAISFIVSKTQKIFGDSVCIFTSDNANTIIPNCKISCFSMVRRGDIHGKFFEVDIGAVFHYKASDELTINHLNLLYIESEKCEANQGEYFCKIEQFEVDKKVNLDFDLISESVLFRVSVLL